MGKYKKFRCPTYPGLLIITLDQSNSMLQPYNDRSNRMEVSDPRHRSFVSKNYRGSRLEVSVNMINRSIDTIISWYFDGITPRNAFYICVIGYNNNVKELCSGWLKDLDANILRYENLKKKISDGVGGIIEVDVHQPVWVEPDNAGNDANMFGAFLYAKELVKKWISDNPQYPAPVIINISDGSPYYDGKDSLECMKETTDLAKEIMSLSNEDGNVLIYNVQVGSILDNTELFPHDRNKLKQEETRFLFDITSEVPESYLGHAHEYCYYSDEIWQQLLWQGSRGLTNKIWDLFPVFPFIEGDESEKYDEIHKIPEPTNDNMAESIKAKWRKGNGYEIQTTVNMADVIRAKWRK